MLKKKERSNFENKYGGKTKKKNVSTSNWAKSFDKSKDDQQF